MDFSPSTSFSRPDPYPAPQSFTRFPGSMVPSHNQRVKVNHAFELSVRSGQPLIESMHWREASIWKENALQLAVARQSASHEARENRLPDGAPLPRMASYRENQFDTRVENQAWTSTGRPLREGRTTPCVHSRLPYVVWLVG